MKTLAKYHVCNHCVVGEKTFKNILIGPGKLPRLSRNGHQVRGKKYFGDTGSALGNLSSDDIKAITLRSPENKLICDYFNPFNFYRNGELHGNQIGRRGVQLRK